MSAMGGKLTVRMAPSSGRKARKQLKMHASLRAVAAIVVLGLVSVAHANPNSAAHEAPPTQALQPTRPWDRVPSDTGCTVERSYANADSLMSLGIHESVSGESFQLIITDSATGSTALRELPGQIKVAGHSIKRWALVSANEK